MLDETQANTLKMVYRRFIESEEPEKYDLSIWNEVDYNLEFVGLLSNQELINECAIKLEEHNHGVFRCSQDHPQTVCFAPYIQEAVGYIILSYNETQYLPVKNEYVLQYFLVMCELRMIFSNAKSEAL